MNFSENGPVPFATADPHYFHSQINKYCKRPFRDEKHMRNTLIENYNKVVPTDGVCFFIGDMAMIGTSQWEKMRGLLNKLNGTKHLILGNHDEIKPFRYIDCGFQSVHTSLQLTICIDGVDIEFVLNHDPCVWDLVPDDYILICGHIHNLFKILPYKNTINVGVDVWGYTPVSLIQAWKHMKRMQDCVLRPVDIPVPIISDEEPYTGAKEKLDGLHWKLEGDGRFSKWAREDSPIKPFTETE
jgi:calcineurin-like phosphoesterase family protein